MLRTPTPLTAEPIPNVANGWCVRTLQLKKTDESALLNQKCLDDIFKNMEQYMAPLKQLNKKSGDGPAEEHDVRKVLTKLYDESSPLTDAMKHMFKLGGAMFTMSIQFLVAQHYSSDPNVYASRLCNDNEHRKGFQTNRGVRPYVAIINSSSSSLSLDNSTEDDKDDSSSDNSVDVSSQAPDTSKVTVSRSKRSSQKPTPCTTTVKKQEPPSSSW